VCEVPQDAGDRLHAGFPSPRELAASGSPPRAAGSGAGQYRDPGCLRSPVPLPPPNPRVRAGSLLGSAHSAGRPSVWTPGAPCCPRLCTVRATRSRATHP
jgi:hypothetical protein